MVLEMVKDKPHIVPTSVFLDTQVFVEAHFDYASRHFRAIHEYSCDGPLVPVLTDLTVREIRSKTREQLVEALDRRPAHILRNSSLPSVVALHAEIPLEALETELSQQLDDYLKQVKAIVLPVQPAALTPVLDRYFSSMPPFGVGKRKAEFPDALALETLSSWCFEQETLMAVVSRDRGVLEFCEASPHLVGFKDVASYLDAFASRNAALSKHIRESIWTMEDEIREGVRDVFPAVRAIAVAGRSEVEVESLDLQEVEFRGDPEIVYLDSRAASVELPVAFHMFADVGFMDNGPPRLARWMHEAFGCSINGTVLVELALTSTGEMTIEEVSIAEPEEFSVDVFEDAEPWS